MASLLIERAISKGRAAFKGSAVRGATWIIGGFGSGQVLRFLNNLILTRLLLPEYFGLMAIVNSLYVGLVWLSDFGVGKSIVQSKRWNDQVFLDTAWTLQIIRGFGVWLLLLAVSVPMARFYGEPILAQLVPVVGITTIINGFNSTKLFTLNREMKLGQMTTMGFFTQVIGIVVMVVWALISPTVWALAIGSLTSTILWMLGSHFILPGQNNRFALEKEARIEIFAFGRWVWLETTMMFFAEQSDRLILGRLFTFTLLGVYSIAFALADLPRQIIKKISLKVIFPLVSGNAELPRSQLRQKILEKRRLVLLGFSGLIAGLVCFGDVAIRVLYDDRYLQATWMMPVLSLGIWFSVLFYTTSPCLLGIGNPVYGAQANLLRFIAIAAGLPLGFNVAGTLGAVIAVAVSDFPSYVAIQYGAWREKLIFWRQDIQLTAGLLGVILFVTAIRAGLGFGTPLDVLLAGGV